MTRRLPALPLTRGECREWVLPCRLTQCRYHLDHDQRTTRKHRLKPLPKRGHPETCALNVAESGPHHQSEVGFIIGDTRQGVSKIEIRALDKLDSENSKRILRDFDGLELQDTQYARKFRRNGAM